MDTSKLSLAISADPALSPTVGASVRNAAAQSGLLSEKKLEDLETAVADVVADAIDRTSKQDDDAVVRISVDLTEGGVTVKVKDPEPAGEGSGSIDPLEELYEFGAPSVSYFSEHLTYSTDEAGTLTIIEIS